MSHEKTQRGEWLMEAKQDGTVTLVVIPEAGAPAGCAMTATQAARLAEQLWARASALRARDVKATALVVEHRKRG